MTEASAETTAVREATPEETIVHLRAECQSLTGIRDRLTRDLENSRNANTALQRHLEGLGEAILEKALEHSLTCGEYDAFAEEWDLPKMKKDFEVTMTVTVTAKNEEDALEMVQDNVSLSSYSEGVQSGPRFEADEA